MRDFDPATGEGSWPAAGGYASEDAEAASRICDALRTMGADVWFDKNELRGGDAWDQKIRQQIRDCTLFIPVISRHAQARPEGYFRLEWRLAEQRSHMMGRSRPFLVPVRIDDTLERDADVPDAFCAVQWVRLPGGEVSPAFVERIQSLLNLDVSSAPESAPATAKSSRPISNPLRRRLLPAVGFLVVILASVSGWFAWRHWGLSASSGTIEKSIAVLPFVDLSERRDQEYFADGLADELLDLLSKVPGLRVIARTSSFQFKGKNEDLRTIGAKLGASYVLEGSFRRSEDQIRIIAQLVRAEDGAHVWSESYDRKIGDVLHLQREIAGSISRVLDVTVEGDSTLLHAINPAAHELFLRGLQAYEKTDKPGLDQAADYFEQALDLDPSYTRAAESLALTRLLEADNGLDTGVDGWNRARQDAERLVKLDKRSVMGHALLARIYTDYDWDWPRAAHEANEALALDPHNALGHYAAGALAAALGRWTEAESHFRSALSVDPLDPDSRQALGNALAGAGRFRDAAAESGQLI